MFYWTKTFALSFCRDMTTVVVRNIENSDLKSHITSLTTKQADDKMFFSKLSKHVKSKLYFY